MNNKNTISIDDRDRQAISYTGQWVKGGTEHEHGGTVTSSSNVGDSFTVTFVGTLITVFGTYDSSSGGTIVSYAIDSQPPNNITSTASSSGTDSYQQKFYDSGTLPQRRHKLVVTMLAVNQNAGPGEGTVWFDYFDVQGNPASAPGINANQSENNPNNSKFPIGTVVGAVMGGLALLVAIVGLVSYLRWKRRRSGYTRTSAQNVFDGPDRSPTLPKVSGGPSLSFNQAALGGLPDVTIEQLPVPYPPTIAATVLPSLPPIVRKSEITSLPGSSGTPLSIAPTRSHSHAPSQDGLHIQAASSSRSLYGHGLNVDQNHPREDSPCQTPISSVYPYPIDSKPRLVVANWAPGEEQGSPSSLAIAVDSSWQSASNLSAGEDPSSDSGQRQGKGPSTIQHMDSGIRAVDPDKPIELPPVYTAS
ncbi:hypothetical protein VKT23_011513 [Stygiomarasmius scandens]|uniref:Uncharacterized protein n=1 Tax=Marasmiellus scandens TaxID=2682957 RepID=A0ABR1JBT3_9AGAR